MSTAPYLNQPNEPFYVVSNTAGYCHNIVYSNCPVTISSTYAISNAIYVAFLPKFYSNCPVTISSTYAISNAIYVAFLPKFKVGEYVRLKHYQHYQENLIMKIIGREYLIDCFRYTLENDAFRRREDNLIKITQKPDYLK